MPQNITNLGGSLPDSWASTQLPIAAYNCSEEDAPPFACMQLKRPKTFKRNATGTSATKLNDAENVFFGHEKIGNQVVWLVCKPDKTGCTLQNPSRFVFAGVQGLKKHSFGTVYQGYPARTLHDGNLNRLVSWQNCGPVEDEWFVLSGANNTAFVCMSHDITSPVGQGVVHTIWIAPNYGPRTVAAGLSLSSNPVIAGKFIQTPTSVLSPFSILDQNDGSGNTLYETVIVPIDGQYRITWNATVWSDTATRGDLLTVTAYRYATKDKSVVATSINGTRAQEIEQDTDASSPVFANVRGKENVAFNGILTNLLQGDGVKFKNESGSTINLLSAAMTIELLAPSPPTAQSEDDLNYKP